MTGIKKLNFLVIVFLAVILFANLPFIGYIPFIQKTECIGDTRFCGSRVITAFLNPIFWLPVLPLGGINFALYNEISFYEEYVVPIQIFCSDYMVSSLNDYLRNPFYVLKNCMFPLLLLLPYWLILSIVIFKLLKRISKSEKAPQRLKHFFSSY
jgi:hypothetical protein